MKSGPLKSYLPTLWIFPKGVSYKGPLPANKLHIHRALQVLISPNGTIVIDQGSGTASLSANVIVIPPFTRHRIHSSLKNCLVIFFEPNAFVFQRFPEKKLLLRSMSGEERQRSLELVKADSLLKGQDIFKFGSSIAGFGVEDLARPQVTDLRIEEILNRMENEIGSSISLESLAADFRLSQSRLIHLFSDEMKMPFRSYFLWLKLRRALVSLSSGDNLTTSAYAAGFSDSAHFSRTFHQTFGFKPSPLRVMQIFNLR